MCRDICAPRHAARRGSSTSAADGWAAFLPGASKFASYDPAVPAADDEITVAAAGKLLGLSQHALEALIERGELEAEVTLPTRTRGHRRIRIRRSAVDDFLERARVKPGELAHLYPACSAERYR
jgi:excisionase family DNA binding protein